MITAIDSSAILAIFRQEPQANAWQQLLAEAAMEGPLIICPVVFAEITDGFPSPEPALAALKILQIRFSCFTPQSAFMAGEHFRRYRAAGGPREHLLPDFLVAAHAQVQADRLASSDKGYLRTYFSTLPLLQPSATA